MRVQLMSALLAGAVLLGACGSARPEAEVGVTTTPPASNDSTVAEHAVIVHIPSLPEDIGLDEIEDPLIEAIDRSRVGEFDGNEIGPEEAVLYMYGPDADALWAAVEPALRAAPLGEGSYAVVRYGEPGARERRVAIN